MFHAFHSEDCVPPNHRLRAIKIEVDWRRTPGRFLLTGSANVLLLPKLSESLAGRMEILTLWPFSQGELRGVREEFVNIRSGDRVEFSYTLTTTYRTSASPEELGYVEFEVPTFP